MSVLYAAIVDYLIFLLANLKKLDTVLDVLMVCIYMYLSNYPFHAQHAGYVMIFLILYNLTVILHINIQYTLPTLKESQKLSNRSPTLDDVFDTAEKNLKVSAQEQYVNFIIYNVNPEYNL